MDRSGISDIANDTIPFADPHKEPGNERRARDQIEKDV